MIKTIAEIKEMDIPSGGLICSVKGNFFYYLAEDGLSPQSSPCFLSPSGSENDMDCALLPPEVGEHIMKMDETFGIMVGGKYAYYGLTAIVSGVACRQNGKIIFPKISNIALQSGALKQDFHMS